MAIYFSVGMKSVKTANRFAGKVVVAPSQARLQCRGRLPMIRVEQGTRYQNGQCRAELDGQSHQEGDSGCASQQTEDQKLAEAERKRLIAAKKYWSKHKHWYRRPAMIAFFAIPVYAFLRAFVF